MESFGNLVKMKDIIKLNYDDFYKFVMSGGILFLLVSSSIFLYLMSSWTSNAEPIFNNWITLISNIIFIIFSSVLIYWSGKKWYANQKIMDEKLRAECELIKKESSKIEIPKSIDKTKSTKQTKNVALVEYRVDSVLPDTVSYNLLKDEKVWFWIANLEPKKYRAYVSIKFKLDSYSEEIKEGYYGGKKAWNLNAFLGIRAPGMTIPKKVIDSVKQGEKLDVEIKCKIKDENDKLVEEKLPVTYRYSPNNNSWYLEP